MTFVTYEEVFERFRGKRVAVVGSAPSCAENVMGYVDSFDTVVRISNYKLLKGTGEKTDVHYSFYGSSIRKTREELIEDGVSLCMCKCPNAKVMDSPNGNPVATDFRYIYKARKDFWFCDTYVPSKERFIKYFNLLRGHIPTTGFSCILDILSFPVKEVYLTGFDFFTSKISKVNEPWKPGKKDDPIGHVPRYEARWIKENLNNYPILLDGKLRSLLL